MTKTLTVAELAIEIANTQGRIGRMEKILAELEGITSPKWSMGSGNIKEMKQLAEGWLQLGRIAHLNLLHELDAAIKRDGVSDPTVETAHADASVAS